VAGSALAIAAFSAWAFRERTRRPCILWGWLWYLGTLVPVIGLVQVGGQAMADRYTYIPLIGCFVAIVWGVSEQAERWRVPPWAVAAVGGAVIVALAAVAWKQAGYWRDSVTLHERALTVTERNWKAWQGLCSANLDLNRYDEAIPACLEAIQILPTFPEAWQTLGVVYASKGEPGAAIPYFRRALELRPEYFNALLNLGSALGNLGDYPQAVSYFREALRLRPDSADAWAYLGLALLRTGDRPGALDAYERLQQIDPARAESLRNRFYP
jgi:tetratricopeptide (TPR) repeat protein